MNEKTQFTVDPDGKWVYRVGGISAFVLVVGYFATFPLYASAGTSPTGAEAQLLHYAPHLTEWWGILWLMIFTDLLYVPIWLGLFQALKGFGRYLMILALVCKGLFVVLDLAVTWPNFVALYTLSANYLSATDIHRAALIAAAAYPSAVLDSPLSRIYAILIPALGTFLSGFVMLKGVFNKGVAYLGFAVGVTGMLAAAQPIFPEALGTMHIISAWLATFWFLAVGWKLYKLSQQTNEEKMKAIVYTQYGSPDVLQLKEVAKPEPKENQVLVKVHAASANALDYRRFEKLSSMGRFMEERFIKSIGKVFGADIAGVVETVGANVKRFRPGNAVFGVAAGSSGGFAEYASANENHLALKPANLSFEAAAAVPVAALTALQGLRDKGQIRAGQKVLINGASGGVGTFAAQIAKAFGADVTAVCSSRNVDMARSIGADHVIDYAKEDFTQGDQRYDLIFAVNGNHPLSAYRRALSPQGSYVCAGGALSQIFQAMLLGPLMSKKNGKKMGFMGITKYNQKDLAYIKELLEMGKVAPVIEKSYPLNEVPSAMRYVAEGHARGKVVVHVG